MLPPQPRRPTPPLVLPQQPRRPTRLPSPTFPTQIFRVENPDDLADPLMVEEVRTGSVLVYFLDAEGRAFDDQYIVAFRNRTDMRLNRPTTLWADVLQRGRVPFTNAPLNMSHIEYRIAKVEKKANSPRIAVQEFPEGAEDGFSTDLADGNILVYFADPQGRTFLGQSIVGYASMDDFKNQKPTDAMRYVLESHRHPFLRQNMTIEQMNLMFCQVHLVKPANVTPLNKFVSAQDTTPLSAFVTPMEVPTPTPERRQTRREKRAAAAMSRVLKAKAQAPPGLV